MVSTISVTCPIISTGSFLMRYEIAVLVEAWIGFYIAWKFFMISFIFLLKLFKLRQADTEKAAARGVYWIPKWPAYSPDLNKIEPCWNYNKDAMIEYDFTGMSEQTREEVINTLRLEWDHMPQELVDHFCMNFHLNLLQVCVWGGDNKFYA
ncbi:hypothetical protein HOY80DRAFT_1031726 [Tuber brumale]|nr:hypothetical protein HOY80DRAFT_1031726 [Tuber brumale]